MKAVPSFGWQIVWQDFFRDWKEKQPYTKDLYGLMVKRGFAKEIYK